MVPRAILVGTPRADISWVDGGSTLEERGLGGIETGVDGRDEDVQWGESTGSGGSSNTVGNNLFPDFFQVFVGKDKADIAFNIRQKTFIVGEFSEETTNGTTNHGVRV